MLKTLRILLLFFISINVVTAQDSFQITKLLLSEEKDDFSPYIWNDNLVFTSERHANLILIEYKDSKRASGVSSLFSAEIINDTTFSSPSILSKNLLSNHHDGPASFTKDGKFIYYSRPNDIGNSSTSRKNEENYLGIYEAEWDGSNWINIKSMPFSDSLYINTHPAISPDGDFIVFASNMPGGKGRADLFVARKISGVWSEPIPLKDKINSKDSDYFPYIHSNGDLYFASDRKGDFDIYKCKVEGDSWTKPEALPSPINSKFNDYSYYMNKRGNSGYFASDRDGFFDLYYFQKPIEDEWECDSLIEESFCYTFPRVKSDELEGLPLKFEWRINGEKPIPEDQLVYCFPSEGRYTVKLNIVDTIYDQVIFTREIYEFLVERVEQPYINVPDEVKVNEEVTFDASESYLPKLEPTEHEWAFGDGVGDKGIEVKHTYENTGRFKISLTIYGAPQDGVLPHYCSFKYIDVTGDAEESSDKPVNQPLDLKAFVKMIEYEPLPEDLYYLNLIGSSDNVMMINLFNSDKEIDLNDSRFSMLSDTSLIHVFKNDNDSYSYYYGATFSLKDAYGNLVEAREAGFTDATIKNFKYTKLQSDEYFLTPMVDEYNQFAVVLKKTDKAIPDYKEEFKKVPGNLGEVTEVYIEGEGYYYVVGESDELNEAYSAYTELRYNGFRSTRIKEFKEESVIAGYESVSSSHEGNSYMIELFKVPDYLAENDTILDQIADRKIISIRIDKKNVAYYIEGGSNLLEAKSTLENMKKLGYKDALISNFSYEKLTNDGFYISSLIESDFTYIITFDSSETPLTLDDNKYKSLLGYKIYEHYDPVSKKYYYQVDAGNNLPIAVLLAKELANDSLQSLVIDRLRYEPLNDDEFYIDELSAGDEQYVLVLGSFAEQQNVYQTFKGFSSCNKIEEFYDEASKEYVYIVGGYESLEEVFLTMDECNSMGLEDVYIQKFVYDPLDPDQFYLKAVNEEEEIFRITLSRSKDDETSKKSTNDQYDGIREDGELIDAYDSETDEFVVAISSSKSLPIALNNLEDAIESGYNSVKVQRYIYSSMDQDRFVIRDLNKEDRYYCVELFHSDSLISPDDPLLRELSRKYPISYSYNDPTKDYVYVIGPLENKEGADEFIELIKADGFADARIMSLIFKTLQHDEFYIEEIDEDMTEFVLTLLRTKNEVEKENSYFDNLPDGVVVEVLLDKETGYYNYVIRDLENIDQADSLYAVIQSEGYPNAKLEKLIYGYLNPDEFTLKTLSESSDDFTVSLIRSKEKLGVDHPMFNEISKESKVYEFYNYKTQEFIYTLDKAEGMIAAFDMILIAKANGFENAKIDRFIYSALNPDHFTLEEIDEDNTLFTIVIEESNTQLDESHFDAIRERGYTVREKYIPGKDKWVYSIGLTDNIAKAKMLVEEAKQKGFENADIYQFNYMPLNADNYYLTKLEENEIAYMLELVSADEKMDMKSEQFDNVVGVYKVSEVYDPVDNKYKYYVGDPIQNEADAEAFRNELIAMGYAGTRVSKFIYTALRVDEYYLETISDSEDIPFVLDEKTETEKKNEIFIYFDYDQEILNNTAVNSLELFYSSQNNIEYEIIVTGHTDSAGDEDYNMSLSRKRAESVKKYLLSKGVEESKITIVAKGETELVYNDSGKENSKKSRRVMVQSKESEDGISVMDDKYELEFFVYFGFDQYFLTGKATNRLKEFINNNYNREYQIILIGHTDSVGDENYNLWLSKKRAQSVKKYLLSSGVEESKISIIAKGETDIIYRSLNNEDYKESRRVLVRSTKK